MPEVHEDVVLPRVIGQDVIKRLRSLETVPLRVEAAEGGLSERELASYVYVRVCWDEDDAWLVCCGRRDSHYGVRKLIRREVQRLLRDQVERKTAVWGCLGFETCDGCILDSVEQACIFMGRGHDRKRRLEEDLGVRLYLAHRAEFDMSTQVLVGIQRDSSRLAVDEVARVCTSIRRAYRR